jgi:aminocarboxymuconate-semialdehyde decarboxylase
MTVIDCQWHWYPPAFCDVLLARETYPRARRDGDGYVYEPSPREAWRYTREFVDLDHQFALMDEAGIDVVVASPSIAGDVTALDPAEGRATAELLNEELAAAQRRHPDRFRALAVLPLQDVAASIELLDDAVARLGLRGVLLHSNVAGGSITDLELWPIYARLQELEVPVFLHPTRAFPEERIRALALEPPLAYMFDTTVAALSLVLAGVLDAYPALKVVHPHLGGALPYLVDRVDVYRSQGRWQLEGSVRSYLPRFYTDTVSESPEALRLAIELYGIDRILFSTDHPYFSARQGVAFVREQLDGADAERVLVGNAAALLGLGLSEGVA